jgi:hypothetical protein
MVVLTDLVQCALGLRDEETRPSLPFPWFQAIGNVGASVMKLQSRPKSGEFSKKFSKWRPKKA